MFKIKDGFYLNSIDNRCTETENCKESSFGLCIQCLYNYYLDKIDNKCKKQENNFSHCKQTLDGKTCETCDECYYFDEDGNCTEANYCSKSDNGKWKKCISGYYLVGHINGYVQKLKIVMKLIKIVDYVYNVMLIIISIIKMEYVNKIKKIMNFNIVNQQENFVKIV